MYAVWEKMGAEGLNVTMTTPSISSANRANSRSRFHCIAKQPVPKMGWKNANLRSEMTRLLRRAGVSGWPRLFHSMRASRQTELQREFPIHVVCSWLANSPRIAQQSYLLVTEDDFARSTGAKFMAEG
jgi:hypothetical protein